MKTSLRTRQSPRPQCSQWLRVGAVIRNKISGETTTIQRKLKGRLGWDLANEKCGRTTEDIIKAYEPVPDRPSKGLNVRPLAWVPHHVQGNGFYGHTVSGAQIVYVYTPDFRARKYRYGIYQYWGANNDRCGHFGEISDPRSGKPKRYASMAAAKAAAQRYWRREVTAMLSAAA